MVKNSFSRQNILKLDARHRSVLTFLWRQYGTPLNNYLSPVPAARIEHSFNKSNLPPRFLRHLWRHT